jgi:hypothetical protein
VSTDSRIAPSGAHGNRQVTEMKEAGWDWWGLWSAGGHMLPRRGSHNPGPAIVVLSDHTSKRSEESGASG